MTVVVAGLEGVAAAESKICCIDGDEGLLAYRGYNIHILAEYATFEEVVFLLWHGRLPKQAELEELKATLAAARTIPKPVEDFLATVLHAAPMDVLRTAVSMLGLYDPEAHDHSEAVNLRKAARLVSQAATIVTTFARLRIGRPPVAGDPALSTAANFLYTLSGKRPDAVTERALDVSLTLHAEHEFNASTFAGRVTAATLSDMHSAVTSAIGAVKGPLHGGANEEVIRMLLEAETPERAPAMIEDRLANKKKIPGFGHRVYHTGDPRAAHQRAWSEELGRHTGHTDLNLTSQRIETEMKRLKNLAANVDFYSASTYYCLGIPADLFTAVFAVSRMAGWTAHVMEQYSHNRLIRPRAEYTGEPVDKPWITIEER